MAAATPGDSVILPLHRGLFSAAVRSSALGGGICLREIVFDHPVVLRTRYWSDAMMFIVPAAPGHELGIDGRTAESGTLELRRRGEEPVLRFAGSRRGLAIMTTQAAFEQAAVTLFGEMPKHFQAGSVRLARPGAPTVFRLAALHQAITHTIAGAARRGLGERALRPMRHQLLLALLEAAEAEGDAPVRTIQRRHAAELCRIEDWLDANADTPVSLIDLCAGTGLKRRTVERVVHDRTGLSACDYLRRRRLSAVRAALLSPGPTDSVTTIAMRFGFLHLGRFAGVFRSVYGETPSAVLARGRAAMGISDMAQFG